MPEDAREVVRAALRWAGAALVDEMELVTGPPGPAGPPGPPGPLILSHEPRITQLEEDVMTLRSAVAALQTTGPTTGPGPGPIPSPIIVNLEMRGNASFALTDIDDTITDATGTTARKWYSRLKASLALRGGSSLDGIAGRDGNYDLGRTLNYHLTGALLAFRYTGDFQLLDEAVRITELSWNAMGTTLGGYTYWTADDNELNTPLAAGIMACVAWACHHNRDLSAHSPMGHNYGAIADKYKDWLLVDFVERWQIKDGATSTTLPPFRKGQGHTWANMTRVMWYLGRLGGGNGNSAQAYFDAATAMVTEKLGQDRVCTTGMTGGRSGRVWMHSVTASIGGTGTSNALQYTTYTRNEFTSYIDLTLEEADARLDTAFWQSIAANYADRVLDGDPEGTGSIIARSVAGDLLPAATACSSSSSQPGSPIPSMCGILYHHCFRGRGSNARALDDGTAMYLAGWDTLGKIGPTLHPHYPTGGTVEVPYRPGYVGGRFFTLMYHGAE